MMEEEEWDESNIREFTKLVEQREKTWELAAEELETINMGSDQSKKELKIGTLITPRKWQTSLLYCMSMQMFLLALMRICLG